MSVRKDLIIELFPHCNMKCEFCLQHNLEEYKKYVRKKDKNYYIDLCEKVIRENNYSHKNIEMWGGELFYDNSLEYTRRMMEFIKFLNPETLTITSNLTISLEDNILFNWLVNRFGKKLYIYSSYDLKGRFKRTYQKDLFWYNLDFIRKLSTDHVVEVGVVMTEDFLLNCPDKSEIKKLFETPQVNVVFYLDFGGYSEETTKNLGKILIELYKQFPKAVDIGVFNGQKKTFENNVCVCHQPDCVFLSYANDFVYKPNYSCIYRGSENLVEKMQKIFGCKNCEYYSICSDVCCSAYESIGLLKEGNSCLQKIFFENFPPN